MANLFSTNLPLQLTSFIGREREIADVKRLLGTTRLLTLTGAGGCGKTRLALHVAENLLDAFPDGVWFVDLAPLSDPTLISQTIASIFDLHESAETTAINLLKNYLHIKNLLIVLDNCEHLIAACAQLSDTLLRACPDLKILATSREALNIAGEISFRVPSLTLTDLQNLPPVETLAHYESIQLFGERASAANHDFQLTQTNAPSVAQICQHLDGMPLAIELAAVRVKALSVEEIAARLDDRFRLLTTGSRTAPTRQQTLRAAIDWSYALLSEPEQILLRRLSVFAGGWTLEAAKAVCSGEGIDAKSVLGLQSQLVDKSMAMAEERGGTSRYRMLETIHQYACEKLADAGEADAWQIRHLHFFSRLGENAELGLHSAEQSEWLDRLEAELNNLRTAMAQALEGKAIEAGLQLASSLRSFWYMRGYLSEGSEWLKRMLSESESVSPRLKAKAFCVSATLARNQGELGRASAFGEQSLVLYRQLGDERGIADALNELGVTAHQGGDRVRAVNLLQTSLNLYREIGFTWGVAYTLLWLADVQMRLEEVERAVKLWTESLALFQELGDTWGSAFALGGLGDAARRRGDYEQATKVFRESLALHLKLNHKADVPFLLESLALVAVALKDSRRAALLFGSAETLRQEITVPLSPSYEADYAPLIAQARAQLGAESFAAAWAEGRILTLEQVIAEVEQPIALPGSAPTSLPTKFPFELTTREVQVLRLLAKGLTDPEIAEQLVLSKRTVHAHLRSIYSKLNVTTRSAATRAAIENKII